MDKVSKINNFSELATALDRYIIEDIKPDHNEMIDLVNTFWKLYEKLEKEINKLTTIDLGAVVYMGKACDAIEIEIEKELYCVKVFQNFDKMINLLKKLHIFAASTTRAILPVSSRNQKTLRVFRTAKCGENNKKRKPKLPFFM